MATVVSNTYGIAVLCEEDDPARQSSKVKQYKMDPDELKKVLQKAERKRELEPIIRMPQAFEYITGPGVSKKKRK